MLTILFKQLHIYFSRSEHNFLDSLTHSFSTHFFDKNTIIIFIGHFNFVT